MVVVVESAEGVVVVVVVVDDGVGFVPPAAAAPAAGLGPAPPGTIFSPGIMATRPIWTSGLNPGILETAF